MGRFSKCMCLGLLVSVAGCGVNSAGNTKGSANASCVRHLRNTSDQIWRIRATNSDGQVYFPQGRPNCRNPNGPCVLQPNVDITMEYTTADGKSSGVIWLKDVHDVERGFGYDNFVEDCPRINPGERGPVVFNDPGKGDIHIWGRSW